MRHAQGMRLDNPVCAAAAGLAIGDRERAAAAADVDDRALRLLQQEFGKGGVMTLPSAAKTRRMSGLVDALERGQRHDLRRAARKTLRPMHRRAFVVAARKVNATLEDRKRRS